MYLVILLSCWTIGEIAIYNENIRYGLVTGATSSMGLAIAERLRSVGIEPIYHSRIHHDIETYGSKYLIGDLANEDDTNHIFNESCNAEVLICCAGRTHLSPDTPLNIEMNSCMEVFKNILFVTTSICKRFIPAMKERNYGRIVVIGGDVVGWGNERGSLCCYALAKASVHEYVFRLASTLRGWNICVNCVAPTMVRQNVNKDKLTRPVTPAEVAESVVNLCSTNCFMSGEVLRLNGGRF